jgi:hypothetical protein
LILAEKIFQQRCGHEEASVAANDDMRQVKEVSNNKKPPQNNLRRLVYQ